MRGLFTKQRLSLEAGQTRSGIANRAQTLRIVDGRVWITVEGIKHDYWLSAGDIFTTIPGRLIVLEADGIASVVDISRPPALQALQGIGAWFVGQFRKLRGGMTVDAKMKRHRLCDNACC